MSRLFLLLTAFGAALAASAENVLWIESENTMGVHRSKAGEAGSEQDRIIPVPWERTTMSNLVSVSRLSAASDDRIKFFDVTGQVFKVWQRGDATWGYVEDGHWRSRTEKSGELSADTTSLGRGLGLWLRVNGGGDVYLLGQSSTNAPVSVMDAENPYAADAELFTENFAVNPCDTEADLVAMVSNAVVGDEINVVAPTGSKLYWYRVPTAGGEAAWCTLEMTMVPMKTPWGAVVQVEQLGYVKCATVPVPYGSGVWYSCVTNAVHDPLPVIRWRHQEEFRR